MVQMRQESAPWIAALVVVTLWLQLGLGVDSAHAADRMTTVVLPTIELNDVQEGMLLFNTDQPGRYVPAPLLKTDVQVTVTGPIVRATVRQEFTNPSQEKGDWLEGIYVFPLPERPP
jgi:Ca-activated chloride channel family protein